MRLTGSALLHDARYNKGTAFTQQERLDLELEGLLPPHISDMHEQLQRCIMVLKDCHTDLERYVYLQDLFNRNRTLFFRLLNDQLVELMPIVYTPTVGLACEEYGHILRDSQGLYVSILSKGRIRQVLNHWDSESVRGIVVTDGERILGLGDLGSFGMGIPIGKSQLYTVCAGIHPSQLLPVTIDVGTNRHELLSDPLYTGLRMPRVRGEEYDDLIDEFVLAVQDRWGKHTLIQWEDFANINAHRLLVKYKDKACTFNDDIQGTASVTLAGMLASNRLSNKMLADHTILIVGAGEAGLGIAHLTTMAMVEESGLTPCQARHKIFLVDSRGLITKDRPSGGITDQKAMFAHEHEHIDNLTDAVNALRPSVLIGVTAQPGMFTEEIVKAVAAIHEHPLIFPLSNPTSKAECTAQDAYTWTDGKCIFASGSPFDPVIYKGRTFVPGQGNNAYIFPGVALAVMATKSSRVTEKMFLLAAQALAATLTREDLAQGRVYPPLGTIRTVSVRIAVSVAEEIFRAGFATLQPRPANLEQFLRDQLYEANYSVYSSAKEDETQP